MSIYSGFINEDSNIKREYENNKEYEQNHINHIPNNIHRNNNKEHNKIDETPKPKYETEDEKQYRKAEENH